MLNIEQNILLKRKGKKTMLIDVFKQNDFKNQPVIIFCHGYKGFKDWGAWNNFAKLFAESGFCFIKFNFSHNGGTVDNPIDFPDLEAFGNNNYTKELEDLNDVLNWLELNFANNTDINLKNISLIGHSRGGGIALIKTSEDSRIKRLITLASVCNFGERSATVGNLEHWKKTGVKFVENKRTKQQLPHYYQFYEDYINNKERLNIEQATKKINVPLLIIHGDRDDAISIKEAKNINNWNKHSELKIIEGANHVFNTKHPWLTQDISNELMLVFNYIKSFILR